MTDHRRGRSRRRARRPQRGDRIFAGPRPRRRRHRSWWRSRRSSSSSPSRACPALSSPPSNLRAARQTSSAYVGPLVFGTILAAAHRADRSRCRSRSGSRCSSRTTRRAGSPCRSPTSSTCSPPCRRVVFGLWGGRYLAPYLRARPRSGSTTTSASSRSSRARPRSPAGRSLTAGVVLAIMILPIITAISPRGLPPDAAAARGGRARARRHPLGDDPDTPSSPTPAPAWSPR